MTAGLSRKLVTGGVSLFSVRVASAVVALAGNVALARLLGAEAFGLYAVVAYVLGIVTLCTDFGMHNCLIRWPGEIGRDVTDTMLTLRVGLLAGFAVLVLLFVGPLASAWYGSPDLYFLMTIALAGTSLGGVFRMSQSLLERDMEYSKVALIEFIAGVGFYAPAVTLAYLGFGVYALAGGEVCRGLAGALVFAVRPFKLALRVHRATAKAIIDFGVSYLAMMITWTLASGVNPIVVGKIAGLKAAGIIRIAEALAGHLTLLKGIGDRLSYSALARYQTDLPRLVDAVRRGRLWQYIVGVLPLFAFTAVGFRLVPMIYGSEWRNVANVLPLLCFSSAVNCLFAFYSAALITIGRNWDVAKFQAVYAVSVWAVAPVCVYFVGYLGGPLAGVLVTPTCLVLHRSFAARFGGSKVRDAAVLFIASWAITAIAWSLGDVAVSVAVFATGHLCVFALNRDLRLGAGRLLVLARRTSTAADGVVG